MSPSAVGRVGQGFGWPKEGCARGERPVPPAPVVPVAPVREACPAPPRPAPAARAQPGLQVRERRPIPRSRPLRPCVCSSDSGDDAGAPDAPSGPAGLPEPSQSTLALSWTVSWTSEANLCGSVIRAL